MFFLQNKICENVDEISKNLSVCGLARFWYAQTEKIKFTYEVKYQIAHAVNSIFCSWFFSLKNINLDKIGLKI